MKKIVSLIIFTVALIWTWNLIHSSAAIGFETHSGIQEKLGELIRQTVLAKKPQARNFRVTRLWTEALSETKVRAIFAYQFMDTADGGETTEQTVEGEAVLFREPEDGTHMDRWTLQSVKTTNDAVTFSEGLVVTPNADGDEAPAAAPAPTETSGQAPAASEHH